MSDDDINQPCWGWASADGSQQARNDTHCTLNPDAQQTQRGVRDVATGATYVFPTQPQPVLPDHAAATVAALQRVIDKLNAGTSPEDLGRDVELLGRIMARRT